PKPARPNGIERADRLFVLLEKPGNFPLVTMFGIRRIAKSIQREPPMSIRTVIVDDEPLAREWIRQNLTAEEGFEIVAECEDGFKAVSVIAQTKPDLLILDIQMPGLDGFGVLRMLEGDPPPAVVFVTAFDRYAVSAFEVHAVDYLLKPVSPERLKEALERSKASLQKRSSEDTAAQLLALLKEVRRYPDWLLIKTDGRSHFVRVRDIDWIESKRNNVLL